MAFYQNDLRCLLIERSEDFQKVHHEGVILFVSRDTPQDTIQLLLALAEKGNQNNEAFWLQKQSTPILIYCHTQELYQKYGAGRLPAITRLGTYVVLPSHGLGAQILSHEFCHVELFNRLDKNWWIYYQKLPCWFDEGLALQFNDQGIYAADSLQHIPRWPIQELKRIDRPSAFYGGSTRQILQHYLVAKLEIKQWLAAHSKTDLFELIHTLKRGDSFYDQYQMSKS